MSGAFCDGYERLRAVVDDVTIGTEWNQNGRVYGLRLEGAIEELLPEGQRDGRFCHALADAVEAALLCGKVFAGCWPVRRSVDDQRRAA